ncbi:glycosyltransferase [Shewanella sp. SM95]|uniref:glycosyltransferase n=1 Tax=Shewanella sp. SM95 TaxID=2912812 RepID=UPI0021D8D090|nr:glycosyltransferase [Shewanella sp. SM95]MCU7999954.1 glycosyltransferase [Shewanella sp. SM95]
MTLSFKCELLEQSKIFINGKNMKTVLIYLPNLNCGGAESVTVRLANYLAGRGYLVKLITSIDGGPLEDILDSRIEYLCLGLKNQWHTLFKMPSLIKRMKPDVIFTTMKESCFIMIVSKYIAFSNAKMVIREANTISFQLKEEQKFVQRIKNYLIAISYRFADKIIALSEEIKVDLVCSFHLSKEISVIPNPIGFDKMKKAIMSPLKHDALNDNTILKLVTVARLYPQKNHLFMVNALAQYININPNVKWFLVGNGPLKEEIKERVESLGISDNVVFLGFQENPLATVNACDVFVLPSLYEGFSNALLEAAALNKKILVSDSQTTSVAFLNKLNIGSFYINDNIDDFGKKLESIVSSDEEQDVSSRMRTEYSEEAVFNSYSKIMFE